MELTVLDGGGVADQGCSKGSCGLPGGETARLSQDLRQKVKNHPCYSEEAHRHYARMHVAVAPACNIQCHYCNRKFDCSNESRPGVVSEVLSPASAAAKVAVVASAIPQTTVVGIAGPGDALANPERTFETFRLIRERLPDIRFCLSTNGLALPDHVDTIVGLGVDHVTVTINCIDPVIGARIYPWIFWNHRRIRGEKAAEILIARQQRGLEALAAAGVLVKVNSVMIPGVNDAHLEEVSRLVKAKGAFMHNIMPLIADAAHGTYFGLTGQREPSEEEIESLRTACAGDMAMMRHCRQCRADAVGLLGEDRGQEFSLDRISGVEIDDVAAARRRTQARAVIEIERALAEAPPVRDALIAVATSGGDFVDMHFGHVDAFDLFRVGPMGIHPAGRREMDDQYCNGPTDCGQGRDRMGDIVALLGDCDAVVAAKIGFGPWERLEAANIHPDGGHAMESVEEALADVFADLVRLGRLARPIPELATA